MSITVFGASGGIGSHVTALAGQRARADHQQAAAGAAPPVKAVVLLTGLAMTCVMANTAPGLTRLGPHEVDDNPDWTEQYKGCRVTLYCSVQKGGALSQRRSSVLPQDRPIPFTLAQ
jgi:uncharacterized protein YbjT (DUF2867 family)